MVTSMCVKINILEPSKFPGNMQFIIFRTIYYFGIHWNYGFVAKNLITFHILIITTILLQKNVSR
jgi:hypothetical protein